MEKHLCLPFLLLSQQPLSNGICLSLQSKQNYQMSNLQGETGVQAVVWLIKFSDFDYKGHCKWQLLCYHSVVESAWLVIKHFGPFVSQSEPQLDLFPYEFKATCNWSASCQLGILFIVTCLGCIRLEAKGSCSLSEVINHTRYLQ